MRRLWFCAAWLGLKLLTACHPFDPGSTVAVVEGQQIRAQEVQTILRRQRDQYGPALLNTDDAFFALKQRALQELIDRRLVLLQAQAAGLEVNAVELQAEIQAYKSSYTEVAFQKTLEKKGISYDDWLRLRKENLLIKKWLGQQYDLDAQAHDFEAAARAYYQGHESEFNVPEAVRVRQIVTDTKEKAESILRRLRQGENFAKLAQDLSLAPEGKNGGDLGFIRRSEFPREFEVCFSMNPGDLSPVIPTLYGFHLLKVLEKMPARTRPFEEVEADIRLRLRRAAQEEETQRRIAELRRQARVIIHEDILKRMPL